MTQTSTPHLDFTALTSQQEAEKASQFMDFAEPSALTIQNILQYSRNLEVKNSSLLNEVEWLKS